MNVRVTARWGTILAACVLTFACPGRKTHDPSRAALRTTEPRLSGFGTWQPCTKQSAPDSVVGTAACGDENSSPRTVSLTASECEDEMRTADDAISLIATSAACTDAAVETLETFDRPSAGAQFLSDLAGAYYIRAQRNDRPSDFVRSLDAADRACEKDSASYTARFNQALAEEALGFSDDAIESWDALHKKGIPGWSDEAGVHYQRLTSERSAAAAEQWSPASKERLTLAAAVNDDKAVFALVAPHCAASRHFAEDEVLPAWANARARKDLREAVVQLNLAHMIAAAFGRATGDHQLTDTVDRIRSTSDARDLRRLAAAHRAFAKARMIEIGITLPADAAFNQAQIALSGVESPLRFTAMLGMATALTKGRHYDQALACLEVVAREATQRHYVDLSARVHSARGYLLMTRGYDIAAFIEYSAAQSGFKDAGNCEGIGAAQNNMIGLLRRIGDETQAWESAYRAQRYLPCFTDPQLRHAYLGENAVSAADLGYPAVALRYQNLAVRMFQNVSADNLEKRRKNLGIALRARAGIHARLGNTDAASADLAASSRLLGKLDGPSPFVPTAFQARLAETKAFKLPPEARPEAIATLGEAITLASQTNYQSLTASLRIERADLYRQSGNRAAAEDDLLAAIATLREEEKTALGSTTAQSIIDRLWSPFFGRSQEAYRRLIRLYVDNGDAAAAFEYAERARAYEPLHLVLQRTDLPAEFRNRIHDGEPLQLADVKEIVPAGTYIFEYSVQADHTYVWVIGHGVARRHTLPVGETEIRHWSHELQRFAAQRQDKQFETALIPPSRALLQEPLFGIPRRARIVIVPDRSMHGLPFAALRDHGEYLIHDHPVTVAASATLYAFSLAQNRQLSNQSQTSLLVLADPTINRKLQFTKDLPDLPSALAEADSIEHVYAGAAIVKPRLIKEKATASAFLDAAADSTILHLAAHGIASAANPSRSYLLLAPAGNDDGGVLDAERLLQQLHLSKTRLVVLSACSSAGGIPVGPEGLAPLVRPFVASGVPAVVGTLWDISDSLATEALLERFHERYRAGDDADVALQVAQREMSQSPSKARHAVWAWSAFQMYGYASSPFRPSANH